MALPIEPDEQQKATIRRLAVLLALWGARQTARASGARLDSLVVEAERALGLNDAEREQLAAYDTASQRFSFLDRRAANWLFGRQVAAVVSHLDDWAVAAPAAAWAIHALNAADAALAASAS